MNHKPAFVQDTDFEFVDGNNLDCTIKYKGYTYKVGARKDKDGIYFFGRNPRTGYISYTTGNVELQEEAQALVRALVVNMHHQEHST